MQDVSYGLRLDTAVSTVLAPAAPAKYKVPTDGTDDVNEGSNPNSWIGTNFPDGAWTSGSTGIVRMSSKPR